MPSEYSFDIVSSVDLQEIDNAINQAKKEITTRYDFKGSQCEVNFDRKESLIHLTAENKMRHEALIDVLKGKLTKREIDLKAVEFGEIVVGLSENTTQEVKLILGLTKENAKAVTKKIKELNLKVHAQVQDDKVRVTSKNKDDLQKVIHEIKGWDFEVPLQSINYR